MSRDDTFKELLEGLEDKNELIDFLEDASKISMFVCDVYDLLNKLHDDFESRTCSNCKFLYKCPEYGTLVCDNEHCSFYDSAVKGSDGCNKFKTLRSK